MQGPSNATFRALADPTRREILRMLRGGARTSGEIAAQFAASADEFRAQAQAFPDGVPQERALGSIALLNRYGPALVQTLVEELPLDPGHHWVLTL